MRMILLLLCLCNLCCAQQSNQADLANLDAGKEFQQVGFGMFLHEGIHNLMAHAEWGTSIEKGSYKQYIKLTSGLNQVHFNAEKWVQPAILPESAANSKKTQGDLIRVLIVDGYSNHDWKQTTSVVKEILEESKLFKVSVSTAPSTTNKDSLDDWNPEFKEYDVIIQNTNNIHNKDLRWPEKIERELEAFVRSGGGLYILHSANNAFPHWKEYDRIIGLGWRVKETGFAIEIDKNKNIIRIPPGEGNNTSHGKRFDALISVLNRHPINNGFPEKWITPSMELYTYPRGAAENLTILSYAYDTATNKSWPVEWVVNYGKGRVYNSSMGHLWKGDIYPISYRCIGFQTVLIRATEWLATGKVTYPLPSKFPRETISVVPETRE